MHKNYHSLVYSLTSFWAYREACKMANFFINTLISGIIELQTPELPERNKEKLVE